MEIVITILLALILVALVSGNKESSRSVGKAIRIGSLILLIGLSCLIFIGYLFFYYFSYTEQSLWSKIGLGLSILFPLLIAWVNKTYIKELFSKDNKTTYKNLAYLLLGVVAWVSISITLQEQKNDNPHFGLTIAVIGSVLLGLLLINRALEKGWKITFMFDESSPWNKVWDKYEKIREEETDRWIEFEKNWSGDKKSYAFERLLDEHYDKIDKIHEERGREQEKVRGLKNKTDWLLVAFYVCFGAMCAVLIGYVWDFAFALVMTLGFVNGIEWKAYATLIGGGVAILGLLGSLR
jgi:hypothetical protein